MPIKSCFGWFLQRIKYGKYQRYIRRKENVIFSYQVLNRLNPQVNCLNTHLDSNRAQQHSKVLSE